jgi:5-methyltetrahydropteroyltriglutamate--homocysteine methyltransferase
MPTTSRTDQVGSLIRPPKLLGAREMYKARLITRDELRKYEDEAILEALQLQKDTGIGIFSDGEMRRDSFMTNVSENVEGFEEHYPVSEQKRPDGSTTFVEGHGKAVAGKLRPLRRIAGPEAEFMLKHSDGPFKITMPSPGGTAGAYRAGVTDKVYPTPADMTRDMVGIIIDEMKKLVAEGVTYIQLDEGLPGLNEGWREQQLAQGNDPDKILEDAIAADNACWDAIPEPITKAKHVCRGNRTAWGGGRGSYDWVADKAFNLLHVDRFLLEYDTDRAGRFEALRFVPKGKMVVLGLVSSKTPNLESQDELLRRIDEASKYCPIEQLALSAQCGFQSAANADGAFMTMDDEKRKLELIVETARKVWG